LTVSHNDNVKITLSSRAAAAAAAISTVNHYCSLRLTILVHRLRQVTPGLTNVAQGKALGILSFRFNGHFPGEPELAGVY